MNAELYLPKLVHVFERLSNDSLQELDNIYEHNVYFKDPFNEVRNLSEVKSVFTHMFATLEKPHFKITATVMQNEQAFVTWDFLFYFGRWRTNEIQCIQGTSHLKYNTNGKVIYHRDYWDAAEELYEKIPFLKYFMRWIKHQIKT